MSKGDNVDELIEQMAQDICGADGNAWFSLFEELYRDMARAALAVIAAHPRYELVELAEFDANEIVVDDQIRVSTMCGKVRMSLFGLPSFWSVVEVRALTAALLAATKAAEEAK